MLKPDALAAKLEDDILQMMRDHGLVIEQTKRVTIDLQVMQNFIEHYADVIDSLDPQFNYVGKLFDAFYYHGPHEILLMVVSYPGPQDVISYTRQLIGATNPALAKAGTIRHSFSLDSMEQANLEQRLVRNLIHASDSPESAARELKIWASYLL